MAVAAGEIILASEQTIARYSADSSSDLALTATITDVPGASVNVTAQTSGAFYVAMATFRFDRTVAGSTSFALGYLNIDGSVDSKHCVVRMNSAVVDTRTCTRTWSGPLTAGSHTLKMQGSCSASGVWSLLVDSGLTVLVFG